MSLAPKYIREAYKPAELQAAIDALQNNHFHNFAEGDARGIVMALHRLGFRIIKTGPQS